MIPLHHEEALRLYPTAQAFSDHTGVPVRLARPAVEAWRDLQAARRWPTAGTSDRARSCARRVGRALAAIDRDVERHREPPPPVGPRPLVVHAGARLVPFDEALRLVRRQR